MYYVHNLNPIILSAGPFQVRWYGMMYLVGFVMSYFLMVRRYKRGLFALTAEQTQNLITYVMIGMMIGARLLYVAVYNPSYYMNNISEIPAIWHGGLSFHGAALGFIVAVSLFCKKYGFQFYQMMDTVVLGSSQGIFWGRLGNFINGELYGRVTDVPWGVIFPEGGPLPRHPSQLYQAFCEGLGVFLILHLIQWIEQKRGFAPLAISKGADRGKSEKKYQNKQSSTITWKRTGVLSTSFVVLYGIGRFTVEFFREPDAQLGYYFGWMTMGQILCAIMIVVGIVLLVDVIRRPRSVSYPAPK